ncbi:hypothetical protein CATMIT_01668, partial [Catenibacterium mitsuokai DSM 15897]
LELVRGVDETAHLIERGLGIARIQLELLRGLLDVAVHHILHQLVLHPRAGPVGGEGEHRGQPEPEQHERQDDAAAQAPPKALPFFQPRCGRVGRGHASAVFGGRDAVADAVAGLDQRRVERLVDHRAQAVDVHAQAVGIRQLLAPHPRLQLLPGDHRRRGFHQRLQDLQRGRVELQQLALAAHLERVEVVFQVGGVEHPGLHA